MRSYEQVMELPPALRRELSVYYLPTSVWARDVLSQRGIKSLGAVQDKPECLSFLVDSDHASARAYMARIGLPLAAAEAVRQVPKATLESILARLEAIEAELREALR